MKKRMAKIMSAVLVSAMAVSMMAGCGSGKSGTQKGSGKSEEEYTSTSLTTEQILKKASEDGKIGNWGLGNEYELMALLAKYDLPTQFLSQDFTMDGLDDDTIELASANTYNEVGLVENDYEGAYGYGDTVGLIDMNKEGTAMLQDNIFCTGKFAEENPNTVKAFLSASIKGWEYACEHPDEGAEICAKYGSTVSEDHQKYMAKETKKLVETDMKGNEVSDIGYMDTEALQQTLDIAKKYVTLDDATAAKKLQDLSVEDICDDSYWKDAKEGKFETPEKSEVSIQLKWLTQAQFMGYFIADAKGYYDEVGLKVNFVQGGGDVAETTAVNNGTVDFGTTYVCNLIVADAGGMDLLEVGQIFQSSGMRMIYKYKNFQ